MSLLGAFYTPNFVFISCIFYYILVHSYALLSNSFLFSSIMVGSSFGMGLMHLAYVLCRLHVILKVMWQNWIWNWWRKQEKQGRAQRMSKVEEIDDFLKIMLAVRFHGRERILHASEVLVSIFIKLFVWALLYLGF